MIANAPGLSFEAAEASRDFGFDRRFSPSEPNWALLAAWHFSRMGFRYGNVQSCGRVMRSQSPAEPGLSADRQKSELQPRNTWKASCRLGSLHSKCDKAPAADYYFAIDCTKRLLRKVAQECFADVRREPCEARGGFFIRRAEQSHNPRLSVVARFELAQ